MAKQINPIETAITEYLKAQGVTYSVLPAGAKKLDGWECDSWSVWFERDGKDRLESTFHTGLGHRESKVPMPVDIARLGKNIIARVEWEKRNVVPVAPHAASVLSSLLLDSSSAEQNFHDWCDELGYDKDSIKAQGIYNACCETLTKMRAFFTGTERQEIQDILQDY